MALGYWVSVGHCALHPGRGVAICNSGPHIETTWESTGTQWENKWENAMVSGEGLEQIKKASFLLGGKSQKKKASKGR